jgi:hypothetical protein
MFKIGNFVKVKYLPQNRAFRIAYFENRNPAIPNSIKYLIELGERKVEYNGESYGWAGWACSDEGLSFYVNPKFFYWWATEEYVTRDTIIEKIEI